MKFAIALAASAYAANAVEIGQSGYNHSTAKPGFSIGNNYIEPDYSQEYGEELPGPDFNRQVWGFDERDQIWDQNDYEERVKVEAEMLVALEALKTSVGYIGYDIVTVNGKIDHCTWRNNQDNNDIYEDEQANWDTFRDMDGKYGKCRDKC